MFNGKKAQAGFFWGWLLGSAMGSSSGGEERDARHKLVKKKRRYTLSDFLMFLILMLFAWTIMVVLATPILIPEPAPAPQAGPYNPRYVQEPSSSVFEPMIQMLPTILIVFFFMTLMFCWNNYHRIDKIETYYDKVYY